MADYPTPPPVPRPAPARISAMAVTSLVLGVLGLFTCGITALFGLIFGIISYVKIKGDKEALKGDGIALAGIIVSVVFLLAIPIFAAMLLPALAVAKQRAQTINCVSNEKILALGVRMYAGDHTNELPSSATWCDAIKSYVGSERSFKCPSANSTSPCDYAFNAALGGMDESKVDPRTVMIFEADSGWNASGGSELMVSRHMRGRISVVAYADGSVQEVQSSQLSTLRWNP
jgi:Domain of unknown function (DUF4190)